MLSKFQKGKGNFDGKYFIPKFYLPYNIGITFLL